MNLKSSLLLVIFSLIILTGCGLQNESMTPTYETITASSAHEMLTEDSNIIILDVRTESEYLAGHISNSILLPYDEISQKADALLTDKNSKILIYCRSGRRSTIASKELISLGYTNIFDMGGLNDWPYELTTD